VRSVKQLLCLFIDYVTQNLNGDYFANAGSGLICDFSDKLPVQEQLPFKQKLAALFPRTSNLDQQKLIKAIESFDLNFSTFAPILKRELRRFYPNTRSAFVRFTDYWLRFGRDDTQFSPSEPVTSQQSEASDALYRSFLNEHRDRAKSQILGIISVAGNGKSVLLARLCHLYSHDLIAVHVCKYSIESSRDPIKFVTSIMAQLVKNLAPFAEALGIVDDLMLKDKTATDLWKEFIVKPLQKCAKELAASQRRRFIAIDALDGYLSIYLLVIIYSS
jgi:hypothetical protein